MRSGVNRHTGQILTGWAHCLQSIQVTVTTLTGSLVMARDFGSAIPGLVDAPGSNRVLTDFYMAAATALKKEEPGFRLTGIAFQQVAGSGDLTLGISGDYFPNGINGDFRSPQPVTARVTLPGAALAGVARAAGQAVAA